MRCHTVPSVDRIGEIVRLGTLGYLIHFILKIRTLVHDAMSLAVVERLLLNVGALTHFRHFFPTERALHDENPLIGHLSITVLFI